VSYEGFLSFGGTEIVNVARTTAYVNTLLPTFGLENCHECEDLPHALGDGPYTSPFVDQPDWFDQDDPSSWGFYGLYPLEINGLDDAVRESAVTQLATDGAVMSAPRQRGREIRVSALLIGADDAAVQYGITWLRYATLGSACRDSVSCTGDHLCYFSACPPICTDSPDAHPVVPVRTCDEGVITTVERACALPYERNLYQVTVIDGPRVVQQFDPVCGAMIRVEFTMVAGVPWSYATARYVAESRTDDPSMIVPEVSCTAGSTSTLRRNLATNPVPLGAGGWVSPDTDAFSATRDTEVTRLPGRASVRVELEDADALLDNLATNPLPSTNLAGWSYLLGNGPADQSRTNWFTNPLPRTANGWSQAPGGAMASGVNQWAANPGLEVDCAGWDGSNFGFAPGTIPEQNLAVDPRATSTRTWTSTRWFGSGGAGAQTQVTLAGDGPADTNSISTYQRKTWTGAPTSNADTGFQLADPAAAATPRFDVTPGAAVRVGGFLRTSAVGRKTAVARIVFYDAGGTAVGGTSTSATGGTFTPLSAATGWTWVEVTREAPAGAVAALALVDVTYVAGTDVVWEVGDTLDGTGAMVVRSVPGLVYTGPYFDGSFPTTGGYTYLWVGTPNNANSNRYVAAIGATDCLAYDPATSPTGDATAGRAGVMVKQWGQNASVQSGGGAVATIGPTPLAPITSTNFRFETWAWTSTAMSVAVVAQFLDAAGEVVYVSGSQNTALVVDAWAPVIVTQTRTSVPASATQVRLVMTPTIATVPAGTVMRFSQARAGLTATSNVSNQWFSGATPDVDGALTFTWDGDPYASASTRTQVATPSYTVTVMDDDPGPGGLDGFIRRTTVVPSTTGTMGFGFNGAVASVVSPVPLTVGGAVSMSIRVRSNVDLSIVRITAGAVSSGSTGWRVDDTTVRELVAGQWTTLTFSGVSNAAVNANVSIFVWTDVADDRAGNTLDMAQGVFEKLPNPGPYFDGTFTDTPSLVYAWAGTANASPSTLTVRQPSVVSTLNTGPGPGGNPGYMHNVVVVPKVSGYSGPAYTQAVTVGPFGTTPFTATMYGRTSSSVTYSLAVQALGAGGAVLAAAEGPLTDSPVGDWVRIDPVTVQAPPGTTAIRVWPRSSDGQILGAGAYVDVARVLIVQGTSLTSPVLGRLDFVGQHTSATTTLAVMPGVQYTASVYAATSRPAQARLTATFRDAQGTIVTLLTSPWRAVRGPWVPTPSTAWTRISDTHVAPAEAASVVYAVETSLTSGAAVVGDTSWFTDMLLERSSVPLSYFDGTFADTPSLDYGWLGTAHASISVLTRTMANAPGPVVDPDCAVVPSAPRPPVLEIACLDLPSAWRRYTALIPAEEVPLWRDSVPIVRVTTSELAARQVRVRFYPNPFDNPVETLDPCDFCGEFVISYIPPESTMTIDGIRQNAVVVTAAGAQGASHLLYSSDGGPMTWPLLSCGISYTVVLDVSPEGVEGVSAQLCTAARE
jgi:hypothetical protein